MSLFDDPIETEIKKWKRESNMKTILRKFLNKNSEYDGGQPPVQDLKWLADRNNYLKILQDYQKKMFPASNID